LKVALTVVEDFRVTVQEPVPEQPPLLQPPKDPVVGVAVRVTTAPAEKLAVQFLVQLIPAGVLVTVPFPHPAKLTVRVTDCGLKVAVTVVEAVSVTVQVPVPLHPPPLHPLKVDPVAAVAARATAVPLA